MIDKFYTYLEKSENLKDFIDIPLEWVLQEGFEIKKCWKNDMSEITLRNAYPYLKSIFENSEKAENKTKSEFVQGHRQAMFTKKQEEEIVNLYMDFNTSKSKIARQYKCSEKTIRNILKKYGL